jgi:hypothetical protein
VTPAHLALVRAAARFVEKIEKLEPELDNPEAWREYCQTVAVLAAIVREIRPESTGELLTTAQMAGRLGIAPKTLLRHKASGKITPAKVLGKRGKAAFRWAAR